MIRVTANARNATYISDDLITSGSVGIPVAFNLSSEFDSLSNIAVFRGSGVSIDVALTSAGECVVPSEAVAQSGGYLQIGVYGRNADGTIVIPTVWAGSKMILPGAVPSGVDPSEPTSDWTAQVQQMATEALEIAQNVEDMSVEAETLPPGSPLNVEKTIDPETGAVTLTFYLAPGRDGITPTIAVTEITGGHRVTITDAQGTRSFVVLDGTNGDDGRGIASAVMNADYTLTLTYTDGTSYTTPSLRGEPGQDGYSPLASVSKVGKVATISITDKQGTTMATVSDGEDGVPGVGVPAGGTAGQVLKKASGTDYDTEWGNEPTVPVQDVQVNGVSVLNDGVAKVPAATNGAFGVVRPTSTYGVSIVNGSLGMTLATDNEVKAGNAVYHPLQPGKQHQSTFYGLAKAAGDTTQSQSSNAVGNYTDEAKAAIHRMIGYPKYELLVDDTISETVASLSYDFQSTPCVKVLGILEIPTNGQTNQNVTGRIMTDTSLSTGLTCLYATGINRSQYKIYVTFVCDCTSGRHFADYVAGVYDVSNGQKDRLVRPDMMGYDTANVYKGIKLTADFTAGTKAKIYGIKA